MRFCLGRKTRFELVEAGQLRPSRGFGALQCRKALPFRTVLRQSRADKTQEESEVIALLLAFILSNHSPQGYNGRPSFSPSILIANLQRRPWPL